MTKMRKRIVKIAIRDDNTTVLAVPRNAPLVLSQRQTETVLKQIAEGRKAPRDKGAVAGRVKAIMGKPKK
jgi:hypothetical protein